MSSTQGFRQPHRKSVDLHCAPPAGQNQSRRGPGLKLTFESLVISAPCLLEGGAGGRAIACSTADVCGEASKRSEWPTQVSPCNRLTQLFLVTPRVSLQRLWLSIRLRRPRRQNGRSLQAVVVASRLPLCGRRSLRQWRCFEQPSHQGLVCERPPLPCV